MRNTVVLLVQVNQSNTLKRNLKILENKSVILWIFRFFFVH